MRLTLTFLLFVTTAIAGPVGRYLGFAVNVQGDAVGAGRDSIHVLFPSPSDTVTVRNRVDTTTIVAETLRGADPAWVMGVASWPTLDAQATDTSYESGETLLCTRMALGDSVRWVNAYRVPFTVGATWSFGFAGTYIYDFTGDTILDTIDVWGDTCTVLDTEDVTVPYGTVPSCYKIRRTMHQRLAAQQSGIPVIESSYIRTVEWYKDSLWTVKESIQASGPVYMKVVIWIHAADFVSTDVSQLNGLTLLGIAEEPHAEHRTPFTACPNPFRTSVLVRLSPQLETGHWKLVTVYDASGRLVLSQPIRASSFILDASSLPVGTYLIRAGDAVCPITKVR